MIVKTDPCQEISRHVIPHHLAHDFVFFCSISIFQLKKNHVSPGICHHSEFWSWLTKVIILHHLTLEWFGTHMWAPRCFLPSHPFTVPSGSIEQTEGKKCTLWDINGHQLSVSSWDYTNLPSSKEGTMISATFAGPCDCESTWTTTGTPNITLSVNSSCREETCRCLNNTVTTNTKRWRKRNSIKLSLLCRSWVNLLCHCLPVRLKNN